MNTGPAQNGSPDGSPPAGVDADEVAAVSALDVPARRRLYEYLAGSGRAVSRDDASAALGIPRQTAAFHLDKLADVGLVDVEFARLNGRDGPGAGRPAKLYRRTRRLISVQLPERSYELAGRLLAEAVEEAQAAGIPPREALAHRAAALGAAIGRGIDPTMRGMLEELQRWGYEPRVEDDDVILANCPFHALAADHTELVCGMNLDLINGMIGGSGCGHCSARLAPHAEYCCVRLRPAPPEGGSEYLPG